MNTQEQIARFRRIAKLRAAHIRKFGKEARAVPTKREKPQKSGDKQQGE